MRFLKITALLGSSFITSVTALAQPPVANNLDQNKLQVFGEINTPKALDEAQFLPLDLAGSIGGLEPVISVELEGVVKAYPVRILAVHAVVNDVLGGTPIAVSYCGPCSSATVLKRGADIMRSAGALYDGTLLLTNEYGTAFWQQRDGALVSGSGRSLSLLNAKIISMARFRQDNAGDAGALVLRDSPNSRLPSETSIQLPNSSIQGSSDLDPDEDGDDKQTVRILGDKAWSLELLNQEKQEGNSDVIILWQPDSSFNKRNIQGPRR